MFNLTSPLPSWLPKLVQPQDWLVIKILVILVIVSLLAGVAKHFERG
jgi:hypothetical protein